MDEEIMAVDANFEEEFFEFSSLSPNKDRTSSTKSMKSDGLELEIEGLTVKVERERSPVKSPTPDELQRPIVYKPVADQRRSFRTFIGIAIPPRFLPIIVEHNYESCRSPLKDLRRISLRELHNNKRYWGGYIILRVLEVLFLEDCLSAIVEDDEGTGALLGLYNTSVKAHRNPEDVMPLATVFALKEPICIENKEGDCELSVDCPSDIILVYDRPDLLNITTLIHWISDVEDPLCVSFVPKNPHDWTMAGHRFKKNENLLLATRCFLLALYDMDRLAIEDSQMRIELYSELFEIYFLQKQFENALKYCKLVLGLINSHRAAFICAGRSSQGLKNFEDAQRYFQRGLNANPKDITLETCLKNSNKRLQEANRGDFDMHAMFLTSINNPEESINCADYTGPVKIVAIEGKGRGVVARTNIDPGTLLVVSKPLAFAWKSDKSESECWEVLVDKLSCMIAKNPKTFGPIIYALYDGVDDNIEEGPVEVFCDQDDAQREPIQDIAKLKRIVLNNAFVDNDDSYKLKTSLQKSNFCVSGIGVFNIASYFNHSCLPNASVHQFNDVLFIRAIKHIEAGQEVLISYVSGKYVASSRKSYCQARGFTCACRICMSYRQLEQKTKNYQQHLFASYENICRCITNTEVFFAEDLITDVDFLTDRIKWTFPNTTDFACEVAMSTMMALRAKIFTMPSCNHPQKREQEMESHLKTLQHLGYCPSKMMLSIENGDSLVSEDSILDQSVLTACSRLAFLHSSLHQARQADSWIRILIALEKIYSGGDVNVLKLKYDYIRHLLDE